MALLPSLDGYTTSINSSLQGNMALLPSLDGYTTLCAELVHDGKPITSEFVYLQARLL